MSQHSQLPDGHRLVQTLWMMTRPPNKSVAAGIYETGDGLELRVYSGQDETNLLHSMQSQDDEDLLILRADAIRSRLRGEGWSDVGDPELTRPTTLVNKSEVLDRLHSWADEIGRLKPLVNGDPRGRLNYEMLKQRIDLEAKRLDSDDAALTDAERKFYKRTMLIIAAHLKPVTESSDAIHESLGVAHQDLLIAISRLEGQS